MNALYPRIRIHARSGYLLAREGLSLTFYIRRSHQEIAQDIHRLLDAYLRAVGSTVLGSYADQEGEWQLLDEAGWAVAREGWMFPT